MTRREPSGDRGLSFYFHLETASGNDISGLIMDRLSGKQIEKLSS